VNSAGFSIRQLISDPGLSIRLQVLAGERGLDRVIQHPRIQKTGLALVGHMHGVVAARIQILGETELSYVEGLEDDGQAKSAKSFFSPGLACVIVTRGEPPPSSFIEEAERTSTPLLMCQERSSVAITSIHALLDERLAPRTRLHGVLVDIHEVGVLLLGKSGIGKSECALELVMRGHRLVADDVVEVDYRPPGMVFGEAAEPLRHHMEVRGLGILNIKDLYGVTAVRERKRVDLVVRLELWRPDASYDRIGLEDNHFEILGVLVREVRLPIQPGRNMSAIIEIAARAELLRRAGHHPARDFVDRLEAGLLESSSRRNSRLPPMVNLTESAAPPPVRSEGASERPSTDSDAPTPPGERGGQR
jgi:HPr kinase/phosphorylase